MSQPMAEVDDGSRKYSFHTLDALQLYLDKGTAPAQQISLSAFLEDFEKFPEADDVLITYFSETVKCAENKQRLAPSMLLGCLSELLILRLIKAVGDYLEDLNAVSNFRQKRRDVQRQLDYTREMVRKGRERLEEATPLSNPQRRTFTEFNSILEQVFNSIRLRRNECVHPEPEMRLDQLQLPSEGAVQAHVTNFNTYAKIILNLINLFRESA